MQFGVLGPLQVTDGDAVVSIGGPRVRTLLVLLLRDGPGRPVGLDRLVDGQYGEDPPADAANAVQAQVSRLRRALPGMVAFEAGGYRLAVEPEDVDAHRFARLAADGRRLLGTRPVDAARLLREALGLWRGRAFAELPDDDPAVAEWAERRLAALEDLAEAELATPAGPSVPELARLVTEHPLRERLQVLHLRALLAAGRTAEALGAFGAARARLRAELGADPGPELAAVHQEILRADRPAPPARQGPPLPLTPIVGRAAELATLAALRDTRLVTLLGPGGAGKTRLAVEWARTSGACFVALTATAPDADVTPAVLAALGVRARGDAVEALVAAVDGEDLLLVLDNCEHVRAAAGVLVRTLLSRCAGLRVLATSREPLGLTGETLVTVPPLAVVAEVPADGAGATGGAVEGAGPAIVLFAQRAAAAKPGFVVDATTVDAVTAICRALDGLPLAIELAAARVRQLPVAAIAERLAGEGRFPLLSRGDPTAEPRHRSLDAVVRWSWDLLRPDEQRLARRFTVFVGGATAEAVEEVCGLGAADLLADLVDRSLLDVDGDRYRMPETIRLFAAAALAEAGEAEELHLRHAAAQLALARAADPHLRRAEQLTWLARLRAEDADLTAALRWAVEHAPSIAFGLVAALSAYRWLAGRPGDEAAAEALLAHDPAAGGEEYVACVLAAGPRATPEQRARAATSVATVDHPFAHPFVLALWGMTLGPVDASPAVIAPAPWNAAMLRLGAALLDALDGRPAAGERELGVTLAEFRALGERWGTAQALDWLAQLASWRGRWAEAHERWAQALRCYGELGASGEAADVLARRAACLLRQGEHAAAAADLHASDDLRARSGAAQRTVAVAVGLADLARHRGNSPAAGAVLATVDPAAAGLASGDPAASLAAPSPVDPSGVATDAADPAATLPHPIDTAPPTDPAVATALGRLAADPGTARCYHRAALAAARSAPLRSALADAAEGAAAVLPATGAAELLGAAVALRGLAIAGDPDVAAVAARAAAELGDTAFAAAYSRAAALPADAALAVVDGALAGLEG